MIGIRLFAGLRTLLRDKRAPSGSPNRSAQVLAPARRPDARTTVGVLVYQGVTTAEIDMPVRALADGLEADVVHIGLGLAPISGVEPVRSVNVSVDVYAEPKPLPDVLVVPGGLGWRRVADDLEVMTWLAFATGQASGVLAISTGSLILASAGKLAGLSATGHWLALDTLAELGADVTATRTAHSDDARIVTAAGAQSAIAAGATLAERVRWGPNDA